MQAMRRLILWEATAMIVVSPDGFASDLSGIWTIEKPPG
jgi:hypothetical protein